MNYIIKPTSVRKSEIVEKEYSFFSSGHRKLFLENNNTKFISDLIDFENVGEQIDVAEYLSFDSGNYLGTISGIDNLLYSHKNGENISPKIYNNSSKKLKKGDVIISRNASLGKISIVNSNDNIILNGGLSYLRFKKEYKFYTIGFFISEYGKEFLVSLTSGGGTQQNAKRQNVLDIKIPFPTTKNNPKPENVEKMLSIIVQNLIHKEEQIQLKNKQIDEAIEKELRENQKESSELKFNNSVRISEIKKETRLDTGLYEREFKEIDFLIKGYKNGFNNLQFYSVSFKSGETPKTYFEKNNGEYIWVSNKDFRKNIWKNYTKINVNNVKNVVPNNSILFSRRAPAGINQVIVENKKMIVNDGIKILTFENLKREQIIFLSIYLNSSFYEGILNQLSGGGVFGGMTNTDIENLEIPNFPEEKQKEIAKLYYNKVEKNSDLDLENYLEKEKFRNEKIGIFQLNMEIFDLRETLENLVYKIVMEEKIDIKF